MQFNYKRMLNIKLKPFTIKIPRKTRIFLFPNKKNLNHQIKLQSSNISPENRCNLNTKTHNPSTETDDGLIQRHVARRNETIVERRGLDEEVSTLDGDLDGTIGRGLTGNVLQLTRKICLIENGECDDHFTNNDIVKTKLIITHLSLPFTEKRDLIVRKMLRDLINSAFFACQHMLHKQAALTWWRKIYSFTFFRSSVFHF